MGGRYALEAIPFRLSNEFVSKLESICWYKKQVEKEKGTTKVILSRKISNVQNKALQKFKWLLFDHRFERLASIGKDGRDI